MLAVDQLSGELRLNKRVRPLISRGVNAFSEDSRDCRLKAGVVTTIRTAIVAAVAELTFGSLETLRCVGEISGDAVFKWRKTSLVAD